MTDARDTLLDRMKVDLIGPEAPDELISDRPTDRYMTGILFPPRTTTQPEDDDEASDADDSDSVGTALDGVKAISAFRPSSAGLSFAIQPSGSAPRLRVRVKGARYRPEVGAEEAIDSPRRRAQKWRREPHSAEVALEVAELRKQAAPVISLAGIGFAGVSLHCRIVSWGEILLITLAATNDARVTEARSRSANEEAAIFQFSMDVECESECSFVPKPDKAGPASGDDDVRTSALLYRHVQQFGVGHTCSAMWDEPIDGIVHRITTSWFPEATVHVVSAEGDIEFRSTSARMPLGASWLASESGATLLNGLGSFVDAYSRWISRMAGEAIGIPHEFSEQAQQHLHRCQAAEQRMRAGIELLRSSSDVMTAFRLANAALALQYSWRVNPQPPELSWRPFQLGFALLCLESIATSDSPDRETMDLLWFPTGGGKTEAYLLLTAFTIFLRRIRAKGNPGGAGVTTFMRYTLRLLTIQQFERAAALICACEMVRLGKSTLIEAPLPSHFASDVPISLGLWVGEGATPNTVEQAEKVLGTDAESSPAQLQSCPCCHEALDWRISVDKSRVEVRCLTSSCYVGQVLKLLPIWTVDEDVYREQPTLVIGTVDKYAQITRNQKTGYLFGIGTPTEPPELVIQDELHLISGPLGSLAGLYETAIDELCRSASGARAKVIGSTATIRRADDQIKALFDRRSFQFPPPGLDHTNSGFAIEDRSVAGRRYIGISTVGRSAKFTQQAVAASLLQAATDQTLAPDKRDGYWTLVNYFNSLRELGGALVLMRDDVARSVREYAARRPGESERDAGMQIELTSRVRSSDIPRYLKDLERTWNEPNHVDIVLASNMISVGMDVSRLGLMVVNGQPKTIAEYIQATSRVGRSQKAPGLVVTLFNAAKSRDRSRYETFASWHRSLYRDVEATSVTPFAPRARDRALHAPYVAMVRHLVRGMQDPGAIAQHQQEVEALLEVIIARIERIDSAEATAARAQLNAFLDAWFDRQGLTNYWNDYDDALLASAESAAERGNRARFSGQTPTPNSLRSVEASVSYVLLEGGSDRGAAQ
ncbi:DNA helicase [Aestuariivirga litoralis]|uniref:DNA helicase n=1 Tax=Aestuariivirga litoralis TaxID=2650924 RepID=A0A2W2BIY8_9HYPH|nr:helicase-related protein [Aestuariivirga litoralis]PZF75857.1 DNA helicase [Aestuariivirga litoralis]